LIIYITAFENKFITFRFTTTGDKIWKWFRSKI